jgi:hypothetical protein
MLDLRLGDRDNRAQVLEKVRGGGAFVQLWHRGRPAGIVTPFTVEELLGVRRVLKAYLAAGNEDGLAGAAHLKLGALE